MPDRNGKSVGHGDRRNIFRMQKHTHSNPTRLSVRHVLLSHADGRHNIVRTQHAICWYVPVVTGTYFKVTRMLAFPKLTPRPVLCFKILPPGDDLACQ